MRSIRTQLILLGVLFLLFGAGVLAQMLYALRLQRQTDAQTALAHAVVARYLALEDSEMRILGELRQQLEAKEGHAPQTIEAERIKSAIDEWLKQLDAWTKDYQAWCAQAVYVQPSAGVASILDKEKRRQADGYAQAADACAAGEFDKARALLNIEEHYRPPPQRTVVAMFRTIDEEIAQNRGESRKFLFFTLLAVLGAFGGIAAASYHVFHEIVRNLAALEKGADLISQGDLEQPIAVTGPAELTSLAMSFNNMRTAVRSRDQQIRMNNQEIKKLNEELKGKLLDRNRQIEAQNQRLLAKNKELEEILYTATHDLRTPLISIQGFGEELKMACDELAATLTSGAAALPPRAKEILEQDMLQSLNYILNGSKRMDKLLDGLLRLSRMGRASVKPETLDMASLLQNVKDALNFQIQESKARIQWAPDILPCTGDSAMIEQVFFNLISNAIKYRSKERPCAIAIESEKTPLGVLYTVRDNGLGISKENLAKVFHAFYRENTDVGGEGLGLAIVSRIMELHGGRIWVESELGKGSSFHVEIPDPGAPKS